MIICKVKECKHRQGGRSCSLDKIKINKDGFCDSYEQGKAVCACYHRNGNSHDGRCWGTKNMEICYCDGNVNRCDFYEKGVGE